MLVLVKPPYHFTCLSHDMDVGGTGQTTNYANSLQIPELALSHLSCSALTLTSLGSTGHIDVYNTVSSDFTLMSSACVTMITTDLVFLANDQSFFPCLIVQAVNSVDYQNNTSIVTSSGSIDFMPSSSATCILEPGVNLYSDSYLIFENCTWIVYVGGNSVNASSTWSAVLGIRIRSPVYLVPVPGANSNLAGSLIINADYNNNGGGLVSKFTGNLEIGGNGHITITQPGLSYLSIHAADVVITSTASVWLNTSVVNSQFQLEIATSNSSLSSLLVGGDDLVASSSSLATSSFILSQSELNGILCGGNMQIGGTTTNQILLDHITYAPSILPTLISIQAQQTVLSNLSVLDLSISFTSPLILLATDFISIQSNVSITGTNTVATIQIIADSDCNEQGLLRIANQSYISTVLSVKTLVFKLVN